MSRTLESAEHQELFWSELMDQLAERNVVPIIGQAWLDVEDDGVTKPLTTALAHRTLDRLGLHDACAEAVTLDDAIAFYMEKRDRYHLQPLYAAVHHVVTDPTFPIPGLLKTLAGVDAFKLFVTTAPDPLLQRALKAVRVGEDVLSYAYSTSVRCQDLPAGTGELPDSPCVVYHLLGRTAVTDSYALTEEDTLEYIYSLQSREKRPNNLFEELKQRSLLVIGSGYSDWLIRFFLRVARDERLRQTGRAGFVAEVSVGEDNSLVRFLQQFSAHTKVFPEDARAFVNELAERWQAHSARSRSTAADARRALPAPEQHPVFISYAHEDWTAAERLAKELEAMGLPVWLDKERLSTGDKFDPQIDAVIARCSFFVPVLSQQARTYKPRYFFSEWRAAVAQSSSFGENRKFILPCRIDDVPRDTPQIPEGIRRLHMEDVVDDASRRAFAVRVRDLFREYQLTRSHP